MDTPIKELREQIDRIDAELIALLKERMAVVSVIGAIKKDARVAPLDAKRWQEVLVSRIKLGLELGLSKQLITTIWDAIHEESLTVEKSQ